MRTGERPRNPIEYANTESGIGATDSALRYRSTRLRQILKQGRQKAPRAMVKSIVTFNRAIWGYVSQGECLFVDEVPAVMTLPPLEEKGRSPLLTDGPCSFPEIVKPVSRDTVLEASNVIEETNASSLRLEIRS